MSLLLLLLLLFVVDVVRFKPCYDRNDEAQERKEVVPDSRFVFHRRMVQLKIIGPCRGS